MTYWMIRSDFEILESFEIYHMTGNKTEVGNKLAYVFDKYIKISQYNLPKIVKEKDFKLDETLNKYYINLTYVEDKHKLLKIIFQKELNIG